MIGDCYFVRFPEARGPWVGAADSPGHALALADPQHLRRTNTYRRARAGDEIIAVYGPITARKAFAVRKRIRTSLRPIIGVPSAERTEWTRV